MHRKILLVEQSDAMRTVAETVLRQNGYEVIAVSAANKAREVLQLARPDLLLVSADVTAPDGSPYYERLRQDPGSSSIPMLLFAPTHQTQVDFPDEVVIPRPFDPRELVNKVSVFIGSGSSDPSDPSGHDADNGLLDQALGLDELHVTDSEVLNRSSSIKAQRIDATKEKMIGLDGAEEPRAEPSDTSKVEAIRIGEGDSKIIRESDRRPQKPTGGSGRLEILSDQYGLADPHSLAKHKPGDSHDYDWFVQAIKSDADATPHSGAGAHPVDPGKLSIQETASVIDPRTAGPAVAAAPGVDKFIDEFKKEIEQIRDVDTSDLMVSPDKQAAGRSEDLLAWEDKLERITAEQLEPFTREFAKELGRQVAEKITSKIDPDKLMRLLKDEILKHRPDRT